MEDFFLFSCNFFAEIEKEKSLTENYTELPLKKLMHK